MKKPLYPTITSASPSMRTCHNEVFPEKNAALPPRATNPSTVSRSFYYASLYPALHASKMSSSAMVKPRLGMNGNGCAGSIASGVSSGKMLWRK